MAGEPHRYELAGRAVPEALTTLHNLFTRAGSEHADIEHNDLMLFETAVIEVAGNVIEHGRPPGEVRWRFRLDVRPGWLEAELSDSGEAFGRPVDAPMPAPESDTGRGIALARAALDELGYIRRGGENHWHMVRRTDRA